MKTTHALSLLLSTGLLAGCIGGGPARQPSATPVRIAPDVVYHNAHIVTANESFDVAEAVAVRNGRILSVGTDADVVPLAGARTRVVDLGGKTVVPGFNDCHVHLDFGEEGGQIDLRHVQTVEELQDELRRAAANTPKGEWIHARLSETAFPEDRLPTRWNLDEGAPDHPVALPRGPHIWIVNSEALELAGITRETPQPPGGHIARDDDGEPTGVLREKAAQRLVGRLLPPPPEPSDEVALRTAHDLLRRLVSLGITSANIAGIRPGDPFRWTQEAYERWGNELPRLTVQLRVYPGYDRYDDIEEGVRRTIEEIEDLSMHTGFGGDRLKLGAIKMSVDGGFTGQAAWVLEPYPDGRSGATRIPKDALYRVAKRAHDLGWQLGVHAIGDGGVAMAVDVLDRIVAESPPGDYRHFLHHITVKPPEETLHKMVRSDIGVCSQPNFTYDLAPYYRAALRGERLETNNPQRSLADRGIAVAYGSDHRPYGPIAGIWAAVTREGRDGEVYGPQERVGAENAIRFYTSGSARLTFDEKERGTLEPGKVADMVVLSEDILSVPPERIAEIGVEKTIIGGEIVYETDRPRTAVFDDGVIWTAESNE